jgi:hypothetical protein
MTHQFSGYFLIRLVLSLLTLSFIQMSEIVDPKRKLVMSSVQGGSFTTTKPICKKTVGYQYICVLHVVSACACSDFAASALFQNSSARPSGRPSSVHNTAG